MRFGAVLAGDSHAAACRFRPQVAVALAGFGLSNGVQVLQLVRCLPLFPTDRTGYDVLLTDGIVQPLWRAEPRAAETARTVVTHLDIRYCLDHNRIVPKNLNVSRRIPLFLFHLSLKAALPCRVTKKDALRSLAKRLCL